MNPKRCDEYDYINFLVAAQKSYSCLEASRVQPTHAHARGFNPEYVCFDGWYSSLENLKLIRDLKWHWLTRLKSNRLVNPDNTGNVPIAGLAISDKGGVVHLMGYGFVKVFRTNRYKR
jgi:hypothetical protein